MTNLSIHYSVECKCWWIKNSRDIIIAEFSSKNKAKEYLVELLLMKNKKP